MRKVLIGVVLAALALPSSAAAGCWATVGFSPLPDGRSAGDAWVVDLNVLQHGRTPLPNAKPSLTIVDDETGERRTFAARTTGRIGVYRARVVFPSAGSWRYEVFDGFVPHCAQTHRLGVVEIADAGGSSFPLWPVLGGLLGAAALGAGALRLR